MPLAVASLQEVASAKDQISPYDKTELANLTCRHAIVRGSAQFTSHSGPGCCSVTDACGYSSE